MATTTPNYAANAYPTYASGGTGKTFNSQQEAMYYMDNYARAMGISPQEAYKMIGEGTRSVEHGPSAWGNAATYSVPAMPLKVQTNPNVKPAATTTTPAKTTTPAVATESPHDKALRLAVEGADKYFNDKYGNLHLDASDPYGVGTNFNDLLTEAIGKVPKTDDDVMKYLNYGDMFSSAVNESTGSERNKLTQDYNKATPYGWEQNYFADTADDPILRQILDQQAGDTINNLKRNLERGTMSQGAYDYAMTQLGYNPDGGTLSGQSSAAMQSLQTLGGGVLGGYRSGLDDVAKEFSNQVANYQLGQSIDPAQLTTNLTNRAATYTGGMEGDIRSALGNTQLYDPNKLISTAGGAVGPSNQPIPGSNPSGTGTVPVEEDQTRTQGTSGVF